MSGTIKAKIGGSRGLREVSDRESRGELEMAEEGQDKRKRGVCGEERRRRL